MKMIRKFSELLAHRNDHFLSSSPDAATEALTLSETRLIIDGKDLNRLKLLASSDRLHARDAKGDTPLHIAARTGSLAVCNLLVEQGANAHLKNYQNQNPADVARIEGNEFLAELLSALLESLNSDTEVGEAEDRSPVVNSPPPIEAASADGLIVSVPTPNGEEFFAELLKFEPEEDLSDFLSTREGGSDSGSFTPVKRARVSDHLAEETDWALSVEPVQISGDSIGASRLPDHSSNNDRAFLEVSRLGKRSKKKEKLNKNTKLSISSKVCADWARDVFSWDNNAMIASHCRREDIDDLIGKCSGNIEPDELALNIERILEEVGVVPLTEGPSSEADSPWNIPSEIDFDSFVEAIEAALNRQTRLPGTQLFSLSKAEEASLLDPMVRTKQELLVGFLEAEAACVLIMSAIDEMMHGIREVGSVTLCSLVMSRPDHQETNNFRRNVEILKEWNDNGRVMDGRQRRAALEALDELDITLILMREIAAQLERGGETAPVGSALSSLIREHEEASKQLVVAHLPYARRLSSRNVAYGEDPEDVFQVAYIGLQNSTRRFDPERGARFMIYSAFWMRQLITRWRADEGSEVRIPAHRFEKLAKLDDASTKLELCSNPRIEEADLAAETGMPLDEVHAILKIPREKVDPRTYAWDDLLGVALPSDAIEVEETQKILSELINELDERQANIIRMRFGIDQDSEMTLEEIGQIFGVTRERIRQLESKALQYLAHPIRKSRLKMALGI